VRQPWCLIDLEPDLKGKVDMGSGYDFMEALKTWGCQNGETKEVFKHEVQVDQDDETVKAKVKRDTSCSTNLRMVKHRCGVPMSKRTSGFTTAKHQARGTCSDVPSKDLCLKDSLRLNWHQMMMLGKFEQPPGLPLTFSLNPFRKPSIGITGRKSGIGWTLQCSGRMRTRRVSSIWRK